jgi:hypothetical protein
MMLQVVLMTQKRSPCPRCLSKDIVTIQYGMPSEMFEQIKLGKVVLGGCCIRSLKSNGTIM